MNVRNATLQAAPGDPLLLQLMSRQSGGVPSQIGLAVSDGEIPGNLGVELEKDRV